MHLRGCSTPGEYKASKKYIVLENKIGAISLTLATSFAPGTARHIQEKKFPTLSFSPRSEKEENRIDYTSSSLTFQGLA